MAASTLNLSGQYRIEQGATYRLKIIYKAGLTVDTATPVDLNGYTARMQLRPKPDSDIIYLTLTDTGTADGQLIVEPDGDQGTIIIYMTDTATNTLIKDGTYDIELVAPMPTVGFPDVIRLVQGKFAVSLNTTRTE